jgi:nitrogen regulatory protein PII
MKIVFLVYREVHEERIEELLEQAGVDFYTEWENVKGKGHETIAHLGSRTFPGLNTVRMIAFENENQLDKVITLVKEFNSSVKMKDDFARLFQMPLERIL